MAGQFAFLYFAAANAAALLLMGLDKRRANRRRRRIRERTLLVLTAAGGGLGAWLAMVLFHHKTRHPSFRIAAPLFTALWAVALLWMLDRGWFG